MRELNIAVLAHRFRLLARHPAFRRDSREERVEALIADMSLRSMFDLLQVVEADATDRMCGYAVSVLAEKSNEMTLDVLGALDPDRVVGLFYALPESRRSAVLRTSASWSHHVNAVRHTMPDALDFIEESSDGGLLDDVPLDGQDGFGRAVVDLLRNANGHVPAESPAAGR